MLWFNPCLLYDSNSCTVYCRSCWTGYAVCRAELTLILSVTDTDTSSWLAMTFKLSWGTPIHFGQWHFTPKLLLKIVERPQDSCAFLCTVHFSNKSLLGTVTIQSCSKAVRWPPQPWSKLGYKPAWSTPFLFNTNGRFSYSIMTSCASCPVISTSCVGTNCESQQPHCMDADVASHQSVSNSLYYFLPFIYFFPLSDPTSLSHLFLFTNFKPEAKFLQIWFILCKLSTANCLECGWKLSERNQGGVANKSVHAAHRTLLCANATPVPCLRLV